MGVDRCQRVRERQIKAYRGHMEAVCSRAVVEAPSQCQVASAPRVEHAQQGLDHRDPLHVLDG